MRKIVSCFLVVLVLLTASQCRKSPDYIGAPDNVDTPVSITPSPITANLQGNIVDENGNPAAGVEVKAGSQTIITGANGFFRFNQAALDKKHTLVTAQKAGYFKGIRHFAATTGTNYVKIKLLKKELAGTVSNTLGGEVSLPNGSKVFIPATATKIAATNADYSGNIRVYAKYIDPSADDIRFTIPGSFSGIDKNGKNAILTSCGMMAVELESEQGEKLQLKSGFPARLTMNIPSAAQSTAPASISLWYVDEQNGLWREEGTAQKQGNQYVGEVKHFSFWNCDFSTGGILLSMKLVNANNQPLTNTAVRLTRPGAVWLSSQTGYTDSLGLVSGMVPANEAMDMEVLDPCGAVLFSQTISAMMQDTDLGTITVTNVGQSIVTVTGRLLNCNSLPVTSGYVTITFDNNVRTVAVDANGRYSTTFAMCANSGSVATVFAIDNGTGGSAQHSTTVPVNLTSPVSNLADIMVCDDTPFEYINYNIDGVDYYWNPQNSFQIFGVNFPGSVALQADNQPGVRQFVLNINGSSTGTFDATFGSTDAFPSGGSIVFLPGFSATMTSFTTMWPDYFEGSFSGQYTHSSTGTTVHTINGTFKVQHIF